LLFHHYYSILHQQKHVFIINNNKKKNIKTKLKTKKRKVNNNFDTQKTQKLFYFQSFEAAALPPHGLPENACQNSGVSFSSTTLAMGTSDSLP